MNLPSAPFFRTRRRLAVLSVSLLVILGAELPECEFLDLLTALATGTYIEFTECPQTLHDCHQYFNFEDVVECVQCEFNGAAPLDGPGAFAKQAAARQVEANQIELVWKENRSRIVRTTGGITDYAEVVDYGRWQAGVAVDPTADKVYWTDWRQQVIRRADYDGTNIEDVLSGSIAMSGLGLDPGGAKLYWSDVAAGTLHRANLDGTGAETLVTGLNGPTDVAVDPAGGKVYWIDNSGTAHIIQRANLDGSGVETVVTGQSGPFSLVFEATSNKLYWTDAVDGEIRRANPDGTMPEVVWTGLTSPGGLAIDPVGGMVYFSSLNNTNIQRANLDGSGSPSTFIPAIAADLALDPTAEVLLWSGWFTGQMARIDLDGTNFLSFDTAEFLSNDIAVDALNGKVYWNHANTGTLQRANLDGSDIEDLVPGIIGFQTLAVDPAGGKVYWVASGVLYRANLDGSGTETLTTNTNLNFADHLAIDPLNDKLYWINLQTIYWSNLNGSSLASVVSGSGSPRALAVDAPNGKLYWATFDQGNLIRRADLNGANVEDFVTGLSSISELAVAGDALYWYLPFARLVQSQAITSGSPKQRMMPVYVLENVAGMEGLALYDAGSALPVELTTFDAHLDGTTATLTWTTATETNNAGFEVEMRSTEFGIRNAALTAPNPQWTSVGWVEGHGTTAEPNRYTYAVAGLDPGLHRFRLKQIDFDGGFRYTPVVEVLVEKPAEWRLVGNYPNPFNPSTVIRYDVPTEAHVTLRVFDIQGRAIRTLVDQPREAGRHEQVFRADGLPSGVYLYTLGHSDIQESDRV